MVRVFQGFRANRGLLLAGAVAYYALLSLIPLLILVLVALSRLVDEDSLLWTLGQYLEFLVPGHADSLVADLRSFLTHREVVGGVLLLTMLSFSALAFKTLQNAMSVIFHHRVAVRRRHFLVSAVLPYLFILVLGAGLLLVTLVAGVLQWMATRNLTVFGGQLSLGWLSTSLIYMLGVAGEIALLTAIYLVMPVGRLSLRRALAGGIAAGILWEITRHALVWYYASISQINVVYGSLATAISVLLSADIAAIVVLLGAQVIAEFERPGSDSTSLPSADGGRRSPAMPPASRDARG